MDDATARQAWLAEIAAPTATPPAPLPGSTPARDPVPAPAQPVATRYRQRYGVMECVTCGLAKEFCRGHAPAAAESLDAARADRNLSQRIADCKGT